MASQPKDALEQRELPPSGTMSPATVTFAPADPANPRNFPEWRKWCIVGAITLIDLTVSWGASAFSPASSNFTKEFNVSSEIGTLGLSTYVAGLAAGPMLLAPLSEYYGRTMLYVIPYGIFLLLLLGTALVQNLGGFLVLRVLSGVFSAVTIANFGGTIADLWPRDQVGPPMSLFLWAAVCGSPSGYFLFAFIAQPYGWRIVFWALLAICGGFWIILCIVLIVCNNETRHSVLLRRRANRINRENAKKAESSTNLEGQTQTSPVLVDVPEEMRRKNITQLFRTTLSRPFRFLSTELIVVFAALYNGYLYGLSYLFNTAFGLVFGAKGYGFDTVEVGLAFLGLVVGISIGPVINIWQERYYQRRIRAAANSKAPESPEGRKSATGLSQTEHDHLPNIPEARVQLGKIAAVLLPISLFWFAWTSVPEYHIYWISPVLATALFGYSFYTLILMSYLYVEDSYMHFAASALAGVGLIRNIAGAGFPLFGAQMFTNLGYNWAGSLLAFLACLLVPIPFVLQRYGLRLRLRSPYASRHTDASDLDGGA